MPPTRKSGSTIIARTASGDVLEFVNQRLSQVFAMDGNVKPVSRLSYLRVGEGKRGWRVTHTFAAHAKPNQAYSQARQCVVCFCKMKIQNFFRL